MSIFFLSQYLSFVGGRIYSVGGHDGTTYLKTVEAYDAETQQYVDRITSRTFSFLNFVRFLSDGHPLQVLIFVELVLVFLNVT